MTYNEEMATILISNNLVSEDQIRSLWHEVNQDKTIGMVLVQNNLLANEVYMQLTSFMSQQQSEAAATPTANVIEATLEDSIDIVSIDPNSVSLEMEEPSPAQETMYGGNGSSHQSPYVQQNPYTQPIPQQQMDGMYDQYTQPMPSQQMDGMYDQYTQPMPSQQTNGMYDQYMQPIPQQQTNGMYDQYMQQMPQEQTNGMQQIHQQQPSHTPPSHPQHNSLENSESPEEKALPLNFMQPNGYGELQESIPATIQRGSSFSQVMLYARSLSATDVHICCDTPITFRIAGTLKQITETALSADDVKALIHQALRPDQQRILEESGDLEFVYTMQGAGRFRSTVMKYRKGLSFTARLIPTNFRTVTEIGLPESSLSLTKWAQGLILITGPAGCGKSTTLSSLIQYINESRNEHIITIENPIENIYPKGQSQVVQREVGLHTLSQDNALRGALRQDPDILVISELRDLESIQLAVSAAETGHLVFGTMNTTDAIRTIDRLIGSFPSDEQPIIRSMVSESLRGVISQQLLPGADGNSVVPAFEVLKVTSPVSNMIRKNETHQLKSTMITGRNEGMVVFDDSLAQLVKEGRITKDTARIYSEDKNRFA